jgi:hypothetical protein
MKKENFVEIYGVKLYLTRVKVRDLEGPLHPQHRPPRKMGRR